MEGLLAELKEWSPLVTVLGVGITIFLLGWRFPSKADVNRGDDNPQKQINQGIELTLAVNKEIREDMRQMRLETAELMHKLYEGIRQMRLEIAKLADKIEANTHTIHERIDERTRELRSEIRELNKDYKAHLLQHAEKH